MAFYKDQDGIIYFGGTKGVTYFDPSEFVAPPRVARIKVNSVKFKGEELMDKRKAYSSEELQLPWGIRSVTIGLADLDYNNVSPSYAYTIKELDDGWIDLEDQTQFTLHALSPGTYHVVIRSKDRYGRWVEGEGLSLTIPHYWYETNTFYWGLTISIVLLIGGIVGFRLWSLRKQRRKLKSLVELRTREISDALKERNIMLKEIHHRVKNNLQIMSSLLNLHARKSKSDEVKSELQRSRSRIAAIATLHEQLYRQDNLQELDAKKYIQGIVQNVKTQSLSEWFDLQVEYEISKVNLKLKKAIPLGLLANEVITNSIKYAWPNRNSGKLKISLYQDNHHIILSISDDGIGYTPKEDTIDGLGMILIKELTIQVKGEFEFEEQNGTVFKLKFPHQYDQTDIDSRR